MISMIVGRCHVSESYMKVIRYFISRLKDGYKTFAALPREKRRWVMREIIKEHKENRDIYNYVMKGGI